MICFRPGPAPQCALLIVSYLSIRAAVHDPFSVPYLSASVASPLLFCSARSLSGHGLFRG